MKKERSSRQLAALTKTFVTLSVLTIFSGVVCSAQTYAKRHAACAKSYGLTASSPDSLVWEYMDSMNHCLVGAAAPDFKAKTINGKTIELNKLKGNVVMINFWAIWCGPCVHEIPWLNKLAQSYSGKKISFISVAVDSLPAVKKYLTSHPFNFATIALGETIMQDIFKLPGAFPYTVIIDKEGKICEWRIGGFDEQQQTISFYKKIIDRVL